MKITYYVNAMIMYEGKNTKVLCDPWITFNRYSTSGLYNYPEIKLSKQDIADIKPDFIYISHTHADHFDPITLALFDRNTPIIISWYKFNFTLKNIKALGFTNITVSDPAQGIALNGDDHCWLEPSEIYSDVDSIGIFKIDNQVIVNANDNPYHEGQCERIRQQYGPIDIACIPYSAAGPYPAFFKNLTVDEKLEKAHQKKLRAYNDMLNYIKTLQPRYVFPFAAGASYGGEKALERKFYGVGSQAEAIQYIQSNVDTEILQIGNNCTYDTESHAYTGNRVMETEESQRDYLKAISKCPGPFGEGGLFHIAPSEQINLIPLLLSARKKQFDWQQKRGIKGETAFYIDTGQEFIYRFTMADDSVTTVSRDAIPDEAYEVFEMPYSVLIGLLTKHYNFSNIKTQHMYFYRKPDVFNKDLFLLMSFLQL